MSRCYIPLRAPGRCKHPLRWLAVMALVAMAALSLSARSFADDPALAFVDDSLGGSESITATVRSISWTTSSCSGCHNAQAGYSHPVNVRPTMAVPINLPLVDGQVTCVTCHDDSSAAAHAQARRDHTPMLRATSPAALCAQCHKPGSAGGKDARTAMHAIMLGKAHLRKPAYVDRFGANPSRTLAPIASASSLDNMLDAVSQSCLTCHDGSVASDVSTGTSTSLNAAMGQMKDHPMGMAYPTRAWITTSSGGYAPFRPAAMLDPRVTLVDGKIGCLSCHSPYSSDDHLLVLPNTRSQLCLTCHAEN